MPVCRFGEETGARSAASPDIVAFWRRGGGAGRGVLGSVEMPCSKGYMRPGLSRMLVGCEHPQNASGQLSHGRRLDMSYNYLQLRGTGSGGCEQAILVPESNNWKFRQVRSS